jgi:hypothetical protein
MVRTVIGYLVSVFDSVGKRRFYIRAGQSSREASDIGAGRELFLTNKYLTPNNVTIISTTHNVSMDMVRDFKHRPRQK